jgi:hypothetical protein
MAGRSTITRVSILLPLLLLLTLPGLAQAQFDYTINGSVTITKYNGSGGDVVIPGAINGQPVTRIGDEAFYGSQGLSNVTIPESVTYIGQFAFYGCTGLDDVTIPENTSIVGQYAFYGCRGLSNVTIPEGVTWIGWKAFADCTSLTAITVAAFNPNYGSLDGVLFNKDQTALIQCPGGKAGVYTMPESVTSIGNSAFSGCGGGPVQQEPDRNHRISWGQGGELHHPG